MITSLVRRWRDVVEAERAGTVDGGHLEDASRVDSVLFTVPGGATSYDEVLADIHEEWLVEAGGPRQT